MRAWQPYSDGFTAIFAAKQSVRYRRHSARPETRLNPRHGPPRLRDEIVKELGTRYVGWGSYKREDIGGNLGDAQPRRRKKWSKYVRVRNANWSWPIDTG